MKQALVLQERERELLRSLPPGLKRKIRQAFDDLSRDPLCGKALIEELKGLRSYKLGAIRIIYKIEHSSIFILTIGPRKTIYQKMILELKK